MCDDLVPVGDARICREYPIEILFCEVCRTAHQRFQIPKQELFPSSYHYRSRQTADVLNGMKAWLRCVRGRSTVFPPRSFWTSDATTAACFHFSRKEAPGRSVSSQPARQRTRVSAGTE
ncbi:hypothetical protein [Bradyrhizobium sp.]|uniref:hypothetical protein n=1 Tax=Bradyrhizobium sp. TaxID=376 RepID=UPI0025C0C662|nr:hypothetical protein [Bradyrhizobium sp.]